MNALLAVDLRSEPEAVVDRAFPWIVATNAVVDLVFADEYRAVLWPNPGPGLRRELDQMTIEDHDRLRVLIGRLPPENQGRVKALVGHTDEILSAGSGDYDFVAVGTHGRTGWSRFWLGSVAERVTRMCRRSVLVVRAQPPLADPPRILFGVDLDEDPAPLLDALVPWAERLHARVDLLNAIAMPPPTTTSAALDAMLIEHTVQLRRQNEEILTRLRDERLPAALRGEVHMDPVAPVSAILERASQYDLVVVGTHGRKGLNHAILGSVAEGVVRRSERTVLVLRRAE